MDSLTPLTQDFSENNILYVGYDYQDDVGNQSNYIGYMDQIRLSKDVGTLW